jgi:hypothetical protein
MRLALLLLVDECYSKRVYILNSSLVNLYRCVILRAYLTQGAFEISKGKA